MAATAGAIADAQRIGELHDRVGRLCGRVNALEGDLVGVLAELFALGAHEGVGWRSAGQYVAWLTGTGRARAGALVATAQTLADFPHTTTRLRAGDITLDQTAAVVRNAPPWADAVMAECAVVMTPSQLNKTARIHQAADTAPVSPPADAPSAPVIHESLQFNGHDAGGYVGRLRLDDDRGAQFEAALRTHLDVLWNEAKAAGTVGHPPTPVDALMRMMRRAADADTLGVDPIADHRRHLVVLHVDTATQVGSAHMGPVLPTWVTAAWTCDATFQMLFTTQGRALGVGPTRTLPRRLRLAVEQRDGGCRVPGCASRIVHLHHIHHHAHGGPSTTTNLIALCPAHHRALHRGELRLAGTDADRPDGIVFTTGNGRTLTAPHPAVPPLPAQRLDDLDTSRHPSARRPDGGRVDWCQVVPFPPTHRTGSANVRPWGHDLRDPPQIDHSG